MTTISNYDGEGPATVLASPVFVISERDDEIEFEVLEVDAGTLRSSLEKDAYYIFGNEDALWARLVSLDLPPINRSTGKLVESVFGEEDGHEE
ncbi:hypothetical protein, partial [Ralstonia pseudosolanacearum]|uniref:hypothetical protein n=1 Tax=Ralstonia pseudosolanacearum TaxID=1310165 RepID=UPI0026757DB9